MTRVAATRNRWLAAVALAAGGCLQSGCTIVYFRSQILDLIGPTSVVAVPRSGGVVNAGQAVLLNGGESYLLYGSGSVQSATSAGFTFAWTATSVPDGAAAPTLANADTSQVTFTATTPGRYGVTLTVSDGAHTGATELTLDVQ